MEVRDLISKGLSRLDERREQRDEELAALVIRNMEAMSDRRTLHVYISVLAAVNGLIWLCVAVFPRDVEYAWGKVSDLDDRIAAVMIAIIFGLGFWLTYTLFRLKFPNIEEQNLDKQFLSSFHYSQHSIKRFRIWVASVVGGMLNVLALMIFEIYRSHGW